MLTFCCVCMGSFFSDEKCRTNDLETLEGLPSVPPPSPLSPGGAVPPGPHSQTWARPGLSACGLRRDLLPSAACLLTPAPGALPPPPATLPSSVPAEPQGAAARAELPAGETDSVVTLTGHLQAGSPHVLCPRFPAGTTGNVTHLTEGTKPQTYHQGLSPR